MAPPPAGNLIERMQMLSEPEVYRELDTSPQGLGSEEVQKRLKIYGPNVISKVQENSLSALTDNFTHLMALLLWAGGLIAFFAGLPQLGISIWLVNLINGIFSYWQERRAEKAISALARMLPAYSRVLRDGHEHMALANELVPGDVILLGEGDRVSADARIIKDSNLRMDQSTLTGESRPVEKSSILSDKASTEPSNIVFAGTSVISGSGVVVAFATGMRTEFGNIASMTETIGKDLSPLQKEMKVVTRNVTLISLSIGAAFFLLAIMVA